MIGASMRALLRFDEMYYLDKMKQKIDECNNECVQGRGAYDEGEWVCTYDDNGLLHSFNDKPAAISPYNTRREWWIHGKRGRPNGKPAIEMTNTTRIWCHDNKVHRDDDEPAYLSPLRSVWVQNGIITRGNDMPAITIALPNSGGLAVEYYLLDGMLHRCDDEPAVIIQQKHGRYLQKHKWYRHNVPKRENTDEPTSIAWGGHNIDTCFTKCTFKNESGQLHRTGDKPARTSYFNNGIWVEEYWIDGERHREEGPAILYEAGWSFYHKGNLHRADGPARCRISLRKDDNTVFIREWWEAGKHYPPSGPLTYQYLKEVSEALQVFVPAEIAGVIMQKMDTHHFASFNPHCKYIDQI